MIILFIAALFLLPVTAAEWKFPCAEEGIASYTAFHAVEKIHVDGHLTEKAWQNAPRSPRFIDIISGRQAVHETHAALLWDDENLYVAYWVEEPFLHAKFTTNNSPIYY